MGFFKLFHSEVGWFLWALIIIGVIWFWRGGTEFQSSHEPYIKPLAPLNTGETYGNIYLSHDEEKQTLDLPENPIKTLRNFFRGSSSTSTEIAKISFSRVFLIDGTAGTKTTDPQEEYVRVLANHENALEHRLSGLTLSGNAYSVRQTIPQAIENFILGSSTLEKINVSMPPEGRAIITSGKSPVGASFRVNVCSAYLGQFQKFVPEFRPDCPSPMEELKKYGPYEDPFCQSFVNNLPVCRSFDGSFPGNISTSCKKFVTERLSYNSCFATHSSEKDFYKDEWRLFLGAEQDLWKSKQEVIKLMDAKGTIIDAVTY